ncbi:MAG: helix-turn-helix transcriptional regulator [Saprospiraceae bacterium]|nr:helix-turn-helix transcriptional regulator [Saprospiraceae bacterium]
MLGILVIGYISTRLIHIQYAIAIYLGLSIMASMLLILRTKPIIRKTKQEKIERLFAIAFLILVPLYLYVSFTSDATAGSSSLNITLSLIFIMLSASKLQEDIERLSLFKAGHQVTEQNLSNYGFTKREREIASLLIQGVSYQEIADQLHISMPTVKTHVSNIYRKSQVRNRAALILLLSQPESPNPL